MKSGRLLEMLLLLQARGQVTAAELAQRLEVSRRTVYRDAEALSSAGVPLYAERGRAGGIRLLPGYRTDVTGLTRDEARALFVLTTGGAQEDLGLGSAARSAILKVMRAVPEPFRPAATATSQRILVDLAGWLRAPDPVGRICAANLDGPVPMPADPGAEWVEVRLRYGGVPAARVLLGFGVGVEVVSPEEVRADLARVAAEVVVAYG